jgi:hypothetical protein
MAGNRKYLKFGLRADRNLADLTDATSAINNLINDLSVQVDVFGNATGFTTLDIAPLSQISSTDIASTLPSISGQIPIAFQWLDSSPEFIDVTTGTAPNQVTTNVLVQPQVTLQDLINRQKAVLGDPPFEAGGDGPNATLIPSTRLNGDYESSFGENNKFNLSNIRKGDRYRFEAIGSETNPAFFDSIAVTNKGSAYVVGDIFVASTSGSHFFSLDDLDDTAETITFASEHGLTNGMEVQYLEDGNTPISGLTNTDTYFIVSATSNSIKLSASSGGDPVNFTKPDFGVGTSYRLVLIGTTSTFVRNVTMPSGNYATAAQDLDANKLNAGTVYTRKDSLTLASLKFDGSYWNDTGDFEIEANIDNGFPDKLGGIQFEGFQGGGFEPSIQTNGLVTIEQDIVEDGSDDNWQLLRGTNTNFVRPFHNITYSTVNGKTRVVFSNAEDGKRVAVGMKVELKLDLEQATDRDAITGDPPANTGFAEGRVQEVVYNSSTDSYYAILMALPPVPNYQNSPVQFIQYPTSGTVAERFQQGVYVDAVDTVGTTDAEFSYTLGGSEVITYSNFNFRRPVGTGNRRRIRFTVWWPKGKDIEERVESKLFQDIASNNSFGFTSFYKTQNTQDFNSRRYSFPFFKDNRASVLQQKTNNELKVQNLLRNSYTPKKKSSETLLSYNSNNTIAQKTISVDAKGLATYGTGNGSSPPAELGDFVVIETSGGEYFAFQIKEVSTNADTFLLDSTFLSKTNYSAGTDLYVTYVKNKGLIGIYKYDYNSSNHRLRPLGADSNNPLGAVSTPVSEIASGDLAYKIDYEYGAGTHATHEYGFKIDTINHADDDTATEANITVEAPFYDSSATLTQTDGIVLIYAPRGLQDRSAITECTGVIGHEVGAEASNNQNTIVLKSVEGLTARDAGNSVIGDFVFVSGSVPFEGTDSSSANYLTQVGSINTSTKTITLVNNSGNAVLVSKIMPAGTTIVFVPSTAGPNSDGWGKQNKEYCIAPLNTAPPWAATDDGLASPSSAPNIVAKELRFTKLSFNNVPTVCVTPYESGMTGTILVTGSAGQMSTTGNLPELGTLIEISGTNTGGSTVPLGTYKVDVRDDTVTPKTFQLKNQDGSLITTAVGGSGGATTGLTFLVTHTTSFLNIKYSAPG